VDIPTPSRTFDITVGGEKQTIVMSYGLFNEVMKVIPSPEMISNLLVTDPFLRDYVVRRVLTGNKKVESDADLIDPFDLDLDMDVLDDLTSWIGEHVLHFFMKSAAKAARTGEKYQATVDQLTRLAQSQTGAES
jgi:hypothetical protein